MIVGVILVLVGIIILFFCRQISLYIYQKINSWAEEAEIMELRKRLVIRNFQHTLIATVLFGMYWLWIGGLLLTGRPSILAVYYAMLIMGLVFLIFNRKLGAISSFWGTERVGGLIFCPVFLGRLNVIMCGIGLLVFAFISWCLI